MHACTPWLGAELAAVQPELVVLLADDGTEVPTGSFLAVADALDCRMTSATLRGDVTAIEVRDADGAEVMASSLPPV